MSLNSFLQTHPHKRKDCIEHICMFLGLSKNGTVESMRARIVDYVDRRYKSDSEEDEIARLELENKIKDEAQKYKQSQNEKMRHNLPLSPIVIKDTQSQSTPMAKEPPSQPKSQMLFNDTQGISVHESTLAGSENDTIEERIDKLDELYHGLTIEEPTLEGDDEFPGVMVARGRKLAEQLVHVESSVLVESNAGDGTNKDVNHEGENGGNNYGGQTTAFEKFEERMHYLVDRALEAVTLKDTQLDGMKAQFSEVVKVTAQMIEKHEKYMEQIVEKTDQTNKLVDELKQKADTHSLKAEHLEKIIKEKDAKIDMMTAQLNEVKEMMNVQKEKDHAQPQSSTAPQPPQPHPHPPQHQERQKFLQPQGPYLVGLSRLHKWHKKVKHLGKHQIPLTPP